MLHLRCVLVGDPCVGKTSLVVSYTRNGFCERYCPTAFDNYSVTVCVDGKPLRLELCDTAGRSEFDTIRPLGYADASVFLLCFNVAKISTLRSATQRWLPEIRALAPSAPIILVGTQSDQRMNTRRGEAIEPSVMGQLASRLQLHWLECSAVTQQNLKEVFDLAILHALCHHRRVITTNIAQQQQNQNINPNFNNTIFVEKEEQQRQQRPTNTPKNSGGGLKQNLRRLVAITKRKFM
ncbi:unnamed protein product [Meloidogyne enterolobii]|uniref:Uncharacterized protein n=4 Tax=Meloidogyne TaxID=189290 RepID=A0A6V7UPB7_MELEN|nr:unnamed protein product [Meloidogyne enterolobii]CAD2162870.1 unnamed protein product [Meloidogyne enterolobii]CAD2186917.1 unnamed protein product [Meloidogyne enterolobii]